jgi:hypothetical protein
MNSICEQINDANNCPGFYFRARRDSVQTHDSAQEALDSQGEIADEGRRCSRWYRSAARNP